MFGSAANVAAALDTMESLEASPPKVLSPGDLSLVKQWSKANATARQAALQDIGDCENCHFEVKRIPF